LKKLERETGIEPATSSLNRKRRIASIEVIGLAGGTTVQNRAKYSQKCSQDERRSPLSDSESHEMETAAGGSVAIAFMRMRDVPRAWQFSRLGLSPKLIFVKAQVSSRGI
jgi:hypothetical protein